MKESERRKEELRMVKNCDSDLIFFDKLKKYHRALRYEKFEEEIIPKLMKQPQILYIKKSNNQSFEICTPILSIYYFPKANKVHLRAENKWVNNGLTWIKNFLKNT